MTNFECRRRWHEAIGVFLNALRTKTQNEKLSSLRFQNFTIYALLKKCICFRAKK